VTTSVTFSGHPRVSTREAKRRGRHPGPTRAPLASHERSRRSLAGPFPVEPEALRPRAPRWRCAGLRRVRLQGFSPCKELGPLGRFLRRAEAVALLGFASSGLSHVVRGSAFHCRPSLSGFRDQLRSFPRNNHGPLRASPASTSGPVSRETSRPS